MPEKRSRSRPRSDEAARGEGATGRSMWSGTISFGLVSVPVELFAGSRRSVVSLRMLAPDGTPLARRYVCPADGEVLDGDDIERGVEVAEGEFVLVSEEELAELAPRRSREIALERFVPRDAIDPAWFVRSYVLVPGAEQRRAYHLLAETMEASGRAGVASFVMRGKAYAVAIFAERGVLRAETLRFGDELRTPESLGLPEADEPPAARLEAMSRHVEALATDAIDPAELEDDREERLRRLAADKHARGEDVVQAPAPVAPEEPESGEVIDLMALLKRRLGEPAARSEGPRRKPARRKQPARAGAQARELEQATKQELYERAQQLDIPGRSRMTRDELLASLRRAG